MLLFLDLETTGLNPKLDAVLEVAAIVVSDDLKTEHARFLRIVHFDRAHNTARRSIDPVVVEMHAANGLWDACAHADWSPVGQVDAELAAFIVETGCKGAQLAGNSIHFDRAFMAEHLPKSLELLHYRQVDVTSLNELARRVWPAIHAARPGAGGPPAHRAMADAEQSLATARYYAEALASARIAP